MHVYMCINEDYDGLEETAFLKYMSRQTYDVHLMTCTMNSAQARASTVGTKSSPPARSASSFTK